MKRLIAFFCLLTLLIPLAACSSSLATEETAATFEETKTEVKATKEKGEIVYPDAFAVGYARIDITGSLPVPVFESEANKVGDPLMLTCTAVWDGEEIALLMSLDIRGMTRAVAEQSTERINKLFGIPAENVIMNCTHTHSAPAAGGGSDASLHWIAQYYKKLPLVVEEALRDLDVVEGVYAGKGHTDGITFVRRYLMKDGTYQEQKCVLGGTPVWFEVFDDERKAILTAENFSSKYYSTNWGVKMVGYDSPYYAIGGYQYGGVWPFHTGHAAGNGCAQHKLCPAPATH